MSESKIDERIVTPNFLVLFGAAYFLFFALDFQIPVLPFYVLGIGGDNTAIGLLMAVFVVCSVVLRPFQGRNINQNGRKRLLIAGMAVYVVAGLSLLTLPSLPLLFLFRALQGFGWGAFLLAFNTLVLDLAPPLRRGQMVGLMGIAPPLSLATAPIFGEYMRISTESNYIILFFFAFAVSLVALFLAALVREPAVSLEKVHKAPLFSRKVLFPSLIVFSMTFTIGGLLTFMPLFGEERNIQSIGIFFTVFALTSVLTRPLAGELSDRLGRAVIFLPGLGLSAIALIIIALADTMPLFFISAVLLGIGFGSAHSAVVAMAADRLPVLERGIGMATFTIAFDLGIVAGSVVLGLMLNWLSFTWVFLLCAAVMLLPIVMYLIREKAYAKV
ncbi:MAG TPA: MFS transporter [Candidatus Limnocylindrales bacterium]|nr:MFS transporter [Candidatus Limnocylindrales bacterium]